MALTLHVMWRAVLPQSAAWTRIACTPIAQNVHITTQPCTLPCTLTLAWGEGAAARCYTVGCEKRIKQCMQLTQLRSGWSSSEASGFIIIFANGVTS